MIVRTNIDFAGYGRRGRYGFYPDDSNTASVLSGFRGFGADPKVGDVVTIIPGTLNIFNGIGAKFGVQYVPVPGKPLQYKAVAISAASGSSSANPPSSKTSTGQNLVVSSASGMSTAEKIAIGAGAVAVIGGVIYMAKRRKKGAAPSIAGFADFMSIKPRRKRRHSRR